MPFSLFTPLSKDTIHSCVFDWPDRASRPGLPPDSWIPPYPYDPADDWDPTNPLDNGVPGSDVPTPPPTTITGAGLKLYYNVPPAINTYPTFTGYNGIIRDFRGDGVLIGSFGTSAGDEMNVSDPSYGGGGSSNVSSFSQAAKTQSGGLSYRGVLNFEKMIAQHPTVAVFTGNVQVVGGQWCGGYPAGDPCSFLMTIRKYHGFIGPGCEIIENYPIKDWTFSGMTGIFTWTFTRTFPTAFPGDAHPFFSWSFTKATDTLTLTYP